MSKYSLNNYNEITKFKDITDQTKTYDFIKKISRFIVNIMVENLIKSSKINLNSFMQQHQIKTQSKFEKLYPTFSIDCAKNLISFDPNNSGSVFQDTVGRLKAYLKYKILNSYSVQRMDGKGRYIIRRLFKAYLTNPQQLPDKTIITLMEAIDKTLINEKDRSILVGSLRNKLFSYTYSSGNKRILLRVIADYIAGMTDVYALREYKELYG
jgi:dGTPase